MWHECIWNLVQFHCFYFIMDRQKVFETCGVKALCVLQFWLFAAVLVDIQTNLNIKIKLYYILKVFSHPNWLSACACSVMVYPLNSDYSPVGSGNLRKTLPELVWLRKKSEKINACFCNVKHFLIIRNIITSLSCYGVGQDDPLCALHDGIMSPRSPRIFCVHDVLPQSFLSLSH